MSERGPVERSECDIIYLLPNLMAALPCRFGQRRLAADRQPEAVGAVGQRPSGRAGRSQVRPVESKRSLRRSRPDPDRRDRRAATRRPFDPGIRSGSSVSAAVGPTARPPLSSVPRVTTSMQIAVVGKIVEKDSGRILSFHPRCTLQSLLSPFEKTAGSCQVLMVPRKLWR